jgi:hypothetical protein
MQTRKQNAVRTPEFAFAFAACSIVKVHVECVGWLFVMARSRIVCESTRQWLFMKNVCTGSRSIEEEDGILHHPHKKNDRGEFQKAFVPSIGNTKLMDRTFSLVWLKGIHCTLLLKRFESLP